MTMKHLKKGYKLVEVPSMEKKRKFGDSNISLLKHGPKYAWTVFKNFF